MQCFLRGWWPSLLYAAAVLWLISPFWLDGQVPAFRDSLHFFYPLWVYVEGLTGPERWLPTWNPWDGFGCSLVGEPTSMIFYPPRWMTLVRVGSVEQRLGGFLLGHLLLAYFSFVYAGIKLGWSIRSTQLAAWGFGLSGPVFFQIYNPPFLVGAAWLPLAMLGVIQIVFPPSVERIVSIRLSSIRLVTSTTMMLLGGDAQTAYHVFLIAGLLLVWKSLRSLRNDGKAWQPLFQSGSGIVLSAALTVGLSAVQIAPTWFWLQQSTRSKHSSYRDEVEGIAPRGYPSPPGPLSPKRGEGEERGFAEVAKLSNDHRVNRIEFAVRPWQYLSLLVPQAFGSYLPEHTRWSRILSSDGRVWVPSFHVGTPILLLLASYLISLTAAKPRSPAGRTNIDVRIALSVALIAMLSSFDWGLFSVWSTICPFYGYFRYPAKWSVFVAWGICAAAAALPASECKARENREAEASKDFSQRFSNLLALGFAAAACLGTAIILIHLGVVFVPFVRERVYQSLQSIPADPLCGTVQIQAVVRQWGWLGIESLLIGVLGFVATRYRALSSLVSMSTLMVILTSIQLGLIARNQTVAMDASKLREAVSKSSRGDSGLARWTFGDHEVFIAMGNRLSIPTGDVTGSALAQAERFFGRLHLLQPWDSGATRLRKLDAEFTLPPRIVDETRRRKPDDFWSHELFAESATRTSSGDRKPPRPKISDVSMEGRHFRFRVQADEELRLILPILDDGGWVSTGTTRLMEANRLLGQRLELRLHRGETLVTLSYFPPGLQIGLWTTCVVLGSVLICLSSVPWRAHRKRR